MMMNPLFPSDNNNPDPQNPEGYLLPDKQNAPVSPLSDAGTRQDATSGAQSAADVIRLKLAQIYDEAPDTKREEIEAQTVRPRSKHQQFMYELSTSGKSLADIQTEWHAYYAALPDAEKHQVWQEFYDNYGSTTFRPLTNANTTNGSSAYEQPPENIPVPTATVSRFLKAKFAPQVRRGTVTGTRGHERRNVSQIRKSVLDTVSAQGRLQPKQHVQSLLFGLATGLIAVVIFLFGFFNEVVIAPFIQPNRASATPIIIDPTTVAVGSTPEIIIPKINVQIPLDYTQTSTDEAAIEAALNNGVVHYPTTVLPGQRGNTAFFGHSSNNIFNPGKYKFAFVLLHELVPDDMFYLTRDGKVYAYKVTSKQVVEPTEVSVLNDIPGKTATATLITCDPPGTSLHRLVVVGEQVSPDPNSNEQGTNTTTVTVPPDTSLPGNGPTLWSRIWQRIF